MKITANHESILASAAMLGGIRVDGDPDIDDLICEGMLEESWHYNGRTTVTTAHLTAEGEWALHERESRRARLSREWARRHG
jgi:hypothetical protein